MSEEKPEYHGCDLGSPISERINAGDMVHAPAGGRGLNIVSATNGGFGGSIGFNGSDNVEVLRFEADGRVFVRGTLVDTDQEVYEAMRSFLGLADKPHHVGG